MSSVPRNVTPKPDELLDGIEGDGSAILDRIAARLDDLEALYDATPAALYRRARGRIATEHGA